MHRFLKRSRVEHQQEVSSVSGAKRDGNRPTGLYWRRLWGWEPTCSALHQPSGDSLSALHETRRENRWGWAKSVLVTRLTLDRWGSRPFDRPDLATDFKSTRLAGKRVACGIIGVRIRRNSD